MGVQVSDEMPSTEELDLDRRVFVAYLNPQYG
jgi:hypothetical protein